MTDFSKLFARLQRAEITTRANVIDELERRLNQIKRGTARAGQLTAARELARAARAELAAVIRARGKDGFYDLDQAITDLTIAVTGAENGRRGTR
ncbi:hypothetical protein AB0M83_02530 [Amycolatopsis sp. NPDC051106]|uniref:hypothetical protein n=1 Tax=unclassified Amycolatopsis TaxID=2618356 RepID=UPI00342FF5F5